MVFAILPIAVILSAAKSGSSSQRSAKLKPHAQPNISAGQGHKIAQNNGCFSCHSIDGTQETGPTWKNLYGSKIKLKNDSTVTADSAYIARSIDHPSSQIVKGFSAVMPNFSYLSHSKIKSLVLYIKSLSNNGKKSS